MKYSFYISALGLFQSLADALPNIPRGTGICGTRGYDDGTESYYDSTKIATYSACSNQCQKDSKCKSFAVGNGHCYLYNVPASTNFEKDSDSPYAFYEATCITTGVSSSTSINSVPSTASISTTNSSTKPVLATTTAKSSTVVTTTKSSSVSSSVGLTTSSSSKTTSRTTTVASSSPTPPCPLPTWVITNFRFVNSSHNLDCAGADAASDLCYTGKNPQPDGYGPPDSVSADISQIGSCAQQNPGSVPLREIGDGNVVRCAGSQIQFEFHGNSEAPSSTPLFALQNTVYCDNGASYRAYGQGNLLMTCTHDFSHNATCLLYRGTGSVAATSWTS